MLMAPGVLGLSAATLLARLAGRVFVVSTVLFALSEFGSAVVVGWVGFALLVPGIVVSPLAGALIDRYGPKTAILVDFSASAMAITGVIFLDLTDQLTPVWLLLLSAVYSITNPLSFAGIRTIFPLLVRQEERSRINSIDISIFSIVDVAGPALGGMLLGILGPSPTFAFVVALYLGGCVAISIPKPVHRIADLQSGLLNETWNGLKYVLANATLRGLAVSYGLYQVAWGLLLVAVPVSVQDGWVADGRMEFTVGALWALSGMAGVFGAVMAGRVQIYRKERYWLASCILLTALAILPVGPFFSYVILTLSLIVVGFLSGPIDVSVLTLRQRRCDTAVIGRVMAISSSLNLCGLPVGSALGGFIVSRSVDGAFITSAVLAIVATLAALLMLRERDN